ncbi:M35 family metallo-endopeptidase [Comamonas sp.]|uniref:M35 family metallo-endopeptidase n=1 Tax=Comamonas sp. TaxID=34028 RepID=UPI0028A6CDE4|nr:M35 family metallo-endopeptidase [Comamonas sp.]
MPYFKIPGPIGTNVPAPHVLDSSPLVRVGVHQAPSHGWNGDVDANFHFSSSSTLMQKRATSSIAGDGLQDDFSRVCYNITGQSFGQLMMGLCDEALQYAQARKAELLRWDKVAKERTLTWFNSSDEPIRDYLLSYIDSLMGVLSSLSPDNFGYDTMENQRDAGCLPSQGMTLDGVAASVCPTDIRRHRILINMRFFTFPRKGVSFGTEKFTGADSQLLTLIHEVSHFNDVAGSIDHFYGSKGSRMHARHPQARFNSDNLASYVLGIDIDAPYILDFE